MEINKNLKDVIFFDLEALHDRALNDKDFKYHFDLLKGNLQDLFDEKESKRDIMSKPFEITSVCRNDLMEYLPEETIKKISDDNMDWLAGKICDGIMEDFWLTIEELKEEVVKEQDEDNKRVRGKNCYPTE